MSTIHYSDYSGPRPVVWEQFTFDGKTGERRIVRTAVEARSHPANGGGTPFEYDAYVPDEIEHADPVLSASLSRVLPEPNTTIVRLTS
ncbi:MAG TPA: hypothetical protein VIJ33_06165 [Solirubrobacteraceae bacterium]